MCHPTPQFSPMCHPSPCHPRPQFSLICDASPQFSSMCHPSNQNMSSTSGPKVAGSTGPVWPPAHHPPNSLVSVIRADNMTIEQTAEWVRTLGRYHSWKEVDEHANNFKTNNIRGCQLQRLTNEILKEDLVVVKYGPDWRSCRRSNDCYPRVRWLIIYGWKNLCMRARASKPDVRIDAKNWGSRRQCILISEEIKLYEEHNGIPIVKSRFKAGRAQKWGDEMIWMPKNVHSSNERFSKQRSPSKVHIEEYQGKSNESVAL